MSDEVIRLSLRGRHAKLTSSQIIVSGFLALILLGTFLLMLPISSRQPGWAHFSDCLFTATSAVCVTGLVVQDTATYWTEFGQSIIIILIQIGGMGVITVAVALAFLSGQKISLRERSVMQNSISAPQVGGIVRLTRMILTGTLFFEGIGALLLLPVMIPRFGIGRGIYYAVFHSISAFCNAGFDLMGVQEPFSSLTGFSQHVLLNVVIMMLITVGGIGFLVWQDVKEHGLHIAKYRLQSKVALLTSLILVLLPAAYLYFFELSSLDPLHRILPSLFQSVTLRTAGFNTMDLGRISSSGHGLMMFCMLIGGSPGSTAGGLKTTTLTVLVMTAVSVFRRQDSVSFLGRRVDEQTVKQAIALLIMYLTLFFLGAVVICRIERLPLISCLFETASAVGTVGITLGITSRLGTVSRLILIALMFLGRVGGLTLIYAAQSGHVSKKMLPLEKLTVG
ncbi:MAG: Trk family potassium uptake protein [Clostridia bacterium]|nr:Trk family potassium uptake protein [Clostridia bacterium]